MEHERGNPLELTFVLKKNNVPISDLASLTKAIFVIKINKTDADDDSLVYLDSTVDTGSITIDTVSSTADVSVDSNDMDSIPIGNYYYALQLHWPGNRRIEITPYEKGKKADGSLKIIQDTIYGTT